jgi:predicted Zn finger-like uncharacterized protein
MLDISKQKVQIPCPNCQAKVTVTLKQVSNEETVKCNSCQVDINLIDNKKSAEKGIKDINKAFSDLEKAFKKFGK